MTKNYLIISLLTTCLISLGCGKETKAATHSSSKSSQPKHTLYLDWHNKCLTKKTGDIDAHIAKYEAQLTANNNDQLARVYLGSACALRAKASFWGPTKLKYLKRGQKLMDQAVKADPQNPRVRMVRAIGSYKVPKRFNRRPIAVADFEFLIPIASTKSSSLNTNERQAILYYAWLTFKEEGHKDAVKLKRHCHQLAPTSKYGKLTAE